MKKIKLTQDKYGFKGIWWYERAKKWQVHITNKGKTIHIGLFKSKELAIEASKQAQTKYHGEFVRVES